MRHEFVAGTVYAMAGASRNHAMITRNLHGMLYGLLGRGPCQNLDQNTKVWISGSNAFYYADATIACPPSFIDERSGVIDNPTVVFEVLSPTTWRIDRSTKFVAYKTLASLRDYVLIDSERKIVEVFSLEQEEWVVRAFESGTAILPSVGVSLDLDELYRHVALSP